MEDKIKIDINEKELMCQVFYYFKQNNGTVPDSTTWEKIICSAMGARHIKGDKHLADGVLDEYCLNIKTLGFKPTILKTKDNRDFLSDPEKFSPDSQMMIQRRTNLPVDLDEQTSTPAEIGRATLKGFEDFVQESHNKFGTTTVLDVIARHGVDRTQQNYLIDIDIFEHHFYDPASLAWRDVIGGSKSKQAGKRVAVEGYDNGKIVARRNGSNSGLYQTNYLIYKDLTKSEHNYTISIPIPSLEESYDRDAIWQEIQNLRKI